MKVGDVVRWTKGSEKWRKSIGVIVTEWRQGPKFSFCKVLVDGRIKTAAMDSIRLVDNEGR
jgi:hypothetical protein